MKSFHWNIKHIKNINTRIVLCFSALIAAIVLLIISTTSFVFTQSFMQQKNNLVLEKTTLIAQKIEENINVYRKLALSVRTDLTFQQYLTSENMNYEWLEERLEARTQYIYGMERIVMADTSLRLLDRYYSADDGGHRFLQLSGFENKAETVRDEFFSSPHNYPMLNYSEDCMQNRKISYSSVIRDDDFNISGYVIMSLEKNYLFADSQQYAKELFDKTYVFSNTGEMIYRLGERDEELESKAAQIVQDGYFGQSITKHREYTLFKQPVISYPEWIVVGVSSDANLKKDLNAIYLVTFGIGILGIMTVVVVSRIISRKITQPINQMKESMARFEEGVLPEKLVPTTEDELGYLVNGFNHMIDDISRFVDAIYHEQEEKKKAEVSALKFQLESLQSQINPHFLYNTLNTVSYLALKNRGEEIRELIQSLNLLLRSTLSDQSELITIEKEIQFLESYVTIQNYRYEQIIELSYEVDDDALDCLIPKLILQPIVENSLLHGIYPKGERGHIRVNISSAGGEINITIADDGVGIDPDTLENLKSKAKGFNRIGMKNVDERLQLYYGEAARLEIESMQSVGTVVSFALPRGKTEPRGDERCTEP